MAHPWTTIFKTLRTSKQVVFCSNHIANHFKCIIHSVARSPKWPIYHLIFLKVPSPSTVYLYSQASLPSCFLCFEIFHLFSHLIMVKDLWNMLLGLVCNYFIEYFYMNVHEGNLSAILFFCWVFVCFGYQGS